MCSANLSSEVTCEKKTEDLNIPKYLKIFKNTQA